MSTFHSSEHFFNWIWILNIFPSIFFFNFSFCSYSRNPLSFNAASSSEYSFNGFRVCDHDFLRHSRSWKYFSPMISSGVVKRFSRKKFFSYSIKPLQRTQILSTVNVYFTWSLISFNESISTIIVWCEVNWNYSTNKFSVDLISKTRKTGGWLVVSN